MRPMWITIILAVAALASCRSVTADHFDSAQSGGGCPPQRAMVAAEEGAGQPIVMLGGVLSGAASTPLAERLASRRRVIRLQHLAAEAGLSGRTVEEGYGVRSERCAMLSALDGLVGSTPVDMVGYSYGGLIALDFALHHPDRVRSLTLIEPPARWILSEQELLRPEQRHADALTMRIKRRLPTESEAAAFICVAFGSSCGRRATARPPAAVLADGGEKPIGAVGNLCRHRTPPQAIAAAKFESPGPLCRWNRNVRLQRARQCGFPRGAATRTLSGAAWRARSADGERERACRCDPGVHGAVESRSISAPRTTATSPYHP